MQLLKGAAGLARTPTIAALIGLLCSGCTGESESPPHVKELNELLHKDSVKVRRIGSASDSISSFTRVVGAAASPDGSHIVVIDQSPPFVRIFGDAAGPVSAVPRGQGPGESRGPFAVAASSAGFLLLDQGVKFVNWTADVLVEGSIRDVRSVAVTSGCSDEWFIYGPSTDSRHWIHALRVFAPDRIVTEPIFEDSVRPLRLAMGKPYGFTGDGAQFYAFHEFGEPKRVLTWSCDQRAPEPARRLEALIPPSKDPEVSREGNGLVLTMSSTGSEPQFAGMAALNGSVIWATVVLKISPPSLDPVAETRLQLVEGNARYAAAVNGAFTIHGATRSGMLILSTYEPFPQVLLVHISALESTLRAGEMTPLWEEPESTFHR